MHAVLLKRNRCGEAALLSLTLVATQSCTPLKGKDDRGAWASCAHRQPPPPPNVAGRGGTLDLVFAMSIVETGYGSSDDAGRPRYQDIGFDLDNTCTGEGQGPSCEEPSWAAGTSHNDGVEGIDNAMGQLAWGQQLPDRAAAREAGNMLLRVRGYSGEPDDDEVEVSLYYAAGVMPRADGSGVGAIWDGQDRWTILPDVLQPADGGAPSVDQPQFVDPHAYVSGGILVSRLDEGRWNPAALAPTLLVPVRHVVLEASLKQVDTGAWELDDAVVGWRVALHWFLYASAWDLASNASLDAVCKFPAFQINHMKQLCRYADISYESDSPQAPCDAMSVSFGFQAKQALLGDMAGPPPALPPCDPSVHPEDQSCDSLGDH